MSSNPNPASVKSRGNVFDDLEPVNQPSPQNAPAGNTMPPEAQLGVQKHVSPAAQAASGDSILGSSKPILYGFLGAAAVVAFLM